MFYAWERESRVMLNESMARLDKQIARLERESRTRGVKRPEQAAKLATLHGDAIAKRALIWAEIQRREKAIQARKR
jgi:hypothetical protein